ncbi:hypothetical protein Tco_1346413 [Tanacetum coccineum]
MAQLKYCDKHNQVGFLRKPDESAGFAEIVDFLRGSNLRYALTTNPTIHDSLVKQFWQTATAKTLADGTLELQATIDTIEYTITEASIRSKLKLADASGITMLPNNEIFEGMGHMGYPTDGSFTFWKSFFTPQWRFLVHHILHCISSKSGGWDQFGSNIATALICLSTGRVYNFSKLIFDGMVANLKSKTKFLMYPRFLQMILDIQTENKHPYLAVTLTKKIFGNMKRGFRGVPRPLLPAMLSIVAPSAGQEAPSVTQPQPSSSVVPPTPPTTQPIPSEATTIPPLSQPAPPTPIAETTTASPSPSPSPAHEPMEHTFEQPSSDQQPPTPRQEATTSQLMTRIDDLEKQLKETKQTFGKAILTLVESSKSGGWDQFGSNIATALICLSTGRVYNFSKLIFDGMVANLKSKTKFLMYPRFLQMILDIQTENKHPYLAVTLTKKIFGNMKRGFRGVPRPLLPAMLSIANPSAGQEAPSVTQPQPSSSVVPPTPPTTQPIPSEATTIPPLSQPAPPTPIAETTTASPSPSPSPAHEPMEHTFEQPSTDQQPPTPRQEATTS